jgi:multiple sugar transport system ATP-binding protein
VNIFVAQFIGSPAMNLMVVRIKSPRSIINGSFRYALPPEREAQLQPYYDRSLILGIRSEDLFLSSPAPKNLRGIVETVEVLGNESYVAVNLQDLEQTNLIFQVRTPPDKIVNIGDEVHLGIVPEKIHFFDPDTSLAIPLKE